jgi:Tfp pilus assembly protein PilN
MAKKTEPTLTGALLTTFARTVGVTAGLIVNKTAELTEVAAQAAGATIRAGKKSAAPKKRKAAVKSAKKRAPRKSVAKKKSTASDS